MGTKVFFGLQRGLNLFFKIEDLNPHLPPKLRCARKKQEKVVIAQLRSTAPCDCTEYMIQSLHTLQLLSEWDYNCKL